MYNPLGDPARMDNAVLYVPPRSVILSLAISMALEVKSVSQVRNKVLICFFDV